MKAEAIMKRVEARIPDLAKAAYAPIDAEMARLLDLAEKMPPAAFFFEVEQAIARVPSLYRQMDQRPIQDELETAIGEAIIGGLTR